MSGNLLTVEQAAELLKLHPKTVLRHIRDGRLPATRIGKAYRIDRSQLDAFAGVASGHAGPTAGTRVTCIVEIPDMTVAASERIATFLNAVAMTGDAGSAPLHVSTAFDPAAKSMKVVLVGSPTDTSHLLGLIDMRLDRG